MKKAKKGFTIVELVIVIAVIGILAAVLIPTFAGVINRANESAAVQKARSALTNILAGNVDQARLNGGEFVVYDGTNVYQFSYINGQLITADGTKNLGNRLELELKEGKLEPKEHKVAGEGGPSFQLKTIIVKDETALEEGSSALKAIKEAIDEINVGTESTVLVVNIVDGEKGIKVVFNENASFTYKVFYNPDISADTVAFIG